MSEVRFSINESVKVRLTKRGLEILKQQHDELFMRAMRAPIWQPPAVDAEGYSEFRLHDLMSAFGEQMYCGNANLPFDTEIKFSMPSLQTVVVACTRTLSQEDVESMRQSLEKACAGGFVPNFDPVMGGAKITNHEIDLEK